MIGLKQRILGICLGTMYNDAVKVRCHRAPCKVHLPDFDLRAGTRLGLLNNFRQEKSAECTRASNEGSGYRKNTDCNKDYRHQRPIYSASVHFPFHPFPVAVDRTLCQKACPTVTKYCVALTPGIGLKFRPTSKRMGPIGV